jgi:4'-phosphopantetheinyl transferase
MARFSRFVRCSFYPGNKPVSDIEGAAAEVFFGQTEDFPEGISSISNSINKDDQLKAGRLVNDKDRKTVMICYTMLRAILSKKLNIHPDKIEYIYGPNGKPGIEGDPLYFSISHTGNSFSFAISDQFHIGIDLEEINRNINFESIIRRFFSAKEGEYILNSGGRSRERFFFVMDTKRSFAEGDWNRNNSSISKY